jgi:hypothetical protein
MTHNTAPGVVIRQNAQVSSTDKATQSTMKRGYFPIEKHSSRALKGVHRYLPSGNHGVKAMKFLHLFSLPSATASFAASRP